MDTAKKRQKREKTLIKLPGGQQRPTVLAVPAKEERDTNVCIASQNTGSCCFGDDCNFTHSPNAAPMAKAKPKPKAGPKAKPGAKPKATPKAGPKTEYDPEQLAARAKIPRYAFSNGRCCSGDRSHYSHSADSANVAMHVPAFDVTDKSDFEATTSEEEDGKGIRGILYHQGICVDTGENCGEETPNPERLHIEPHSDHLVQELDMAPIASEMVPVRPGRDKIDNEDIHLFQKMGCPT